MRVERTEVSIDTQDISELLQHSGQEFIELAPEHWPLSIKKLSPHKITMRRTDIGMEPVLIAVWNFGRFGSCGLIIAESDRAAGQSLPQEDDFLYKIHIDDGIVIYEQEG